MARSVSATPKAICVCISACKVASFSASDGVIADVSHARTANNNERLTIISVLDDFIVLDAICHLNSNAIIEYRNMCASDCRT